MAKIFQGELPKTINVVIDRKVVTTARFVDGVYETENKEVIAELKRYGYEVEEVKKPVKEVKEEEAKPEEKSEEKPKAKPKTSKKKGVK